MTNRAAPAGKSAEPALPVDSASLIDRLRSMGIAFLVHDHKPVFTVEESAFLTASIPGTHCRNLFLRDKKERMFLVVAANETPVDLKKLQTLLACDRLSFGSPDRLWTYLGVRPGSVCPFAVINDKNGKVRVVLDETMMKADIVNYHPMENHLTVGLSPAALLQFLHACGHDPQTLDLSAAAPDKPDKKEM